MSAKPVSKIPVMSKEQIEKLSHEFLKNLDSFKITDPIARKYLTMQAINAARLAWIDGISAYLDIQVKAGKE